ncbi:hypothetical protein BJY01DRAFT_61397 [Aspergillus pseudoustus]|uniref:Pre-mRNA-splicing factor 38B n=1 Tax=Aspergillus pseudoustus TaxID=1810923 RepID=A0ABR4J800_9EURO
MPPGPGNAIGDPDNDDYVAQVLADEARNSSLKYSSIGAEAYMIRRPTGSAPRPNTRFLRHIIKETDNHNTALKRKEEREARERMRQLRAQDSNGTKDRHRHRTHRSDDRVSRRDTRKDDEHKYRSQREKGRSRSTSSDGDREPSSGRRREKRDRDEDRHRRSRKTHRHRSYSRSRSRSPDARDSKYRDRNRSHRRRRSPSPRSRDRRREKRSVREKNSPSPVPDSRNGAAGDDSDPLEDLVGPLPKEEAPIRSRGRGAYKSNSSNIDAHFAADYDPALDVQPEDDDAQTSNRPSRRPVAGLMTGDDDWELALEALRDRARWKQNGEERLREAGFNTDIIDRWKSNTSTAAGDDEGRIDSVKWSTKSEGREWDRGKFTDKDGHVDVKASW